MIANTMPTLRCVEVAAIVAAWLSLMTNAQAAGESATNWMARVSARVSASNLSCRYRFLLADPQPWKELAWSNVVEQSHGAQAAGILDLNPGKRFPPTIVR